MVDQGQKLGLRLEKQPQTAVLAGIAATRAMFPNLWFDSEKCERGIDGLSQYRYEWNESRHTLSPNPLHDWASHPADALRTGAGTKSRGGTVSLDYSRLNKAVAGSPMRRAMR